MSQSSKHVADSINQVANDVKNKIKTKGNGNESFNSSKKITKDEKNTSN